MVPALGWIKPAIALSKVVLPQPEGPSKAAIWPAPKLNERLSRIFRLPNSTSRFLISTDVMINSLTQS